MSGLLTDHWGDFASLIGLAVTILFAFQAKSAAEQARDAAIAALARVTHLDMVEEISLAIAEANEIAKLHRDRSWRAALERYPVVRARLVRITQLDSLLDRRTAEDLRHVMHHFRIMEKKLETVLAESTTTPLNTPEMNGVLAAFVDLLEKSKVVIRQAEQKKWH